MLICGTLRNKWLCFIYDVHCKHNTQDWRPILTLTLPQTDCVMVNAWCQNISDNVNICGKSLQQPLQLLVPVVVAVMVPRAPTSPFLTDFSLLLQHVYKVVTVQTRYCVACTHSTLNDSESLPWIVLQSDSLLVTHNMIHYSVAMYTFHTGSEYL